MKKRVTDIWFQEFVMGLSLLARGSLKEKLEWAFTLYDVNRDGVITRDEMLCVISSIYNMMGRFSKPLVDEDSARDHVDIVFRVSPIPLETHFRRYKKSDIRSSLLYQPS